MYNSLICWIARFRVSIVFVMVAISVALGSLEHLEEADDDDYDLFNTNETKPGQFLGSYCADNSTCNPYLRHVFCNPATHTCECDAPYPVMLGLRRGCAQAVLLGEQCFYSESCAYNDPHSECVQIRHNAQCKCKAGFHSVATNKPTRREFCSKDLVVIKSDLQTLLGVASGLAIFIAAICFVLKLFVESKPRSFGNARISTPIVYSSNNAAIPLRSSSIKLDAASTGSLAPSTPQSSRRGSGGILVTSSRAGAAHAAALLLYSCSQISQQHSGGGTVRHTANNSRRSSSISPVHSNHSASSFKSYSARRFERDIEMRLKAAKRRQESSLSLAKQRSTDKLLEDAKYAEEAVITIDSVVVPISSIEPSTSQFQTSSPVEKPLSLPFAKAQSIGQPLSLPLLSGDNDTAGSSNEGEGFEWITTPT